MIAVFEKLLNGPRDGALLRFSLGTEYLKLGDAPRAASYFRDAIARDPHYSAAYKGLGKALTDLSLHDEALAAYRDGIAAATARGDMQAAREMTVFARRLEKRNDPT